MKEFTKYLAVLIAIIFVIGFVGYVFNSSRIDEAYNKNMQVEYAKSQNTSYLLQ